MNNKVTKIAKITIQCENVEDFIESNKIKNNYLLYNLMKEILNNNCSLFLKSNDLDLKWEVILCENELIIKNK